MVVMLVQGTSTASSSSSSPSPSVVPSPTGLESSVVQSHHYANHNHNLHVSKQGSSSIPYRGPSPRHQHHKSVISSPCFVKTVSLLVLGLMLVLYVQWVLYPLLLMQYESRSGSNAMMVSPDFLTATKLTQTTTTTTGASSPFLSNQILNSAFQAYEHYRLDDSSQKQDHTNTIDHNHPTRDVRSRRRPHVNDDTVADGTFNGAPVYLHTHETTATIATKVHCVGENYHPTDAWKQRTCRFAGLFCFNMSNQDYVVFQSPTERYLSSHMVLREFMHASSTLVRAGPNHSQTVSIGGINSKWGQQDGVPRLEWFPKVIPIRSISQQLTYYALPESTVLIPFHSLNGANPGHLVWDDFLPIYTALHMFQMLSHDLLLMRYVIQDDQPRGLWASCDIREEKRKQCQFMMNKFYPLMVGSDYPYSLTSTKTFEFRSNMNHSDRPSELICAKHGLAGLGSLTDHGTEKLHGWEPEDYQTTHNHGRGGLLYEFRNFMMSNMDMDLARMVPSQGPFRIVFSEKSSDIPIRSLDFDRQIDLVKAKIPNAQVERYVFKEHSLQEQLEIIKDAAVFVTLCGGGAVTGMFLPKGASIILYYAEDGGAKYGKLTNKPALLDWDLYNAMSHLRVHWLPRNSMSSQLDEKVLVLLIQHELEIIESQVFT